MKLQVFLYGYFNYAQQVADAIAEKYSCKCDQIPPAYQCNEEKLVFIVYEKYGPLESKMMDYLAQVDKKKVLNVALVEISNNGNEGIDKVKSVLEANGVNISGVKNITVPRKLFKKGNITKENIEEALAFADEEGKKNFEFLRKQG